MMKKRKNVFKIKNEDKKKTLNTSKKKEEFSNNSSFSLNASNTEQPSSKKRKSNSFFYDFENPETDEHILKKIRKGDRNIFIINKDYKGESSLKSEENSSQNLVKDTVVRLKNRNSRLNN